ncbi:hypothetical protein pdam_00015891, partial [Pocillopora damicornis]
SVTESVKRILNSHNVKVAPKPFQTLGCIFAKPKDPVTKELRTEAIYSIPCNDCDNEYSGQTKLYKQSLLIHEYCTRTEVHKVKGNFAFLEQALLEIEHRQTLVTISFVFNDLANALDYSEERFARLLQSVHFLHRTLLCITDDRDCKTTT